MRFNLRTSWLYYYYHHYGTDARVLFTLIIFPEVGVLQNVPLQGLYENFNLQISQLFNLLFNFVSGFPFNFEDYYTRQQKYDLFFCSLKGLVWYC